MKKVTFETIPFDEKAGHCLVQRSLEVLSDPKGEVTLNYAIRSVEKTHGKHPGTRWLVTEEGTPVAPRT